jgi:hypothetical protein
MPLPDSLRIGLKEWKLVADALASGRQMLLLRKGGIFETNGDFAVEHPRFVFFPTYLHQHPRMLKADAQDGYEPLAAEPKQVTFAAAGEVTDIIQVGSRAQMDRLDAEHVWATPLIDMRFGYKPDKPLYLLLVRAYVLREPVTVANAPAYGGCTSWVPLEADLPTAGATPVMDDAAYEARRTAIKAVFE